MKELTPNRWFVWTIVVVIIAGIALVGYIKVSDINLTNSPESSMYTTQHATTSGTAKTPVKKY